MTHRRIGRLGAIRLGVATLAVSLLWACSDENLFGPGASLPPEIIALSAPASVRSGDRLDVRAHAVGELPIRQFIFRARGAVTEDQTIDAGGLLKGVIVDAAFTVPVVITDTLVVISVTAEDVQGSVSVVVSDTVRVIDTAPPTVSVALSATEVGLGSQVEITVSAQDNVALVTVGYRLVDEDGLIVATEVAQASGGTHNQTFVFEVPEALAVGPLSVEAFAEDADGNAGTQVSTQLLSVFDALVPAVEIVHPAADSLIATTDPFTLVVDLTDNVSVTSVAVESFSFSGDASLGTQVRVERFQSFSVAFESPSADTALTRLMVPTSATEAAETFIVVTARDARGNSTADTVSVQLVQLPPTIDVTAPEAAASDIPFGLPLAVEVSLADNRGIASFSVQGVSRFGNEDEGTDSTVVQFEQTTVQFETAPTDTVVARFLTPSTGQELGPVRIVVTARDLEGNVETDSLDLNIVMVPPTLSILAPSSGAGIPQVAVDASITVQASIQDNAGIASVKMEGVSRFGDADLGTDSTAVRFEEQVVLLAGSPADTILTRDLLPAGDQEPGAALILVTVVDIEGNTVVDSVDINLTRDDVAPTVLILSPLKSLNETKTIGDTVGVQLRVLDDTGVTSVQIDGFARRGDPDLGTDIVVERYTTSIITFDEPVMDTTVTRALLPNEDLTPESVFFRVTAVDVRGNTSSDETDVLLDAGAPSLTITDPPDGSARPVGDSLRITVDAFDNLGENLGGDNAGIASIDFVGFNVRGDPEIGTDTIVIRYEPLEVLFENPDPSTTLSRILIPTADTVAEAILVVATATDTHGQTTSDTITIVLGGPKIELLDLEGFEQTTPGRQVKFRARFSDKTGLVKKALLEITAFDIEQPIDFNPPAADTIHPFEFVIPDDAEGSFTISVKAENALGIPGGPITQDVIVVPEDEAEGDTDPPELIITADAAERMEVIDDLSVLVTGTDGVQGSGIAFAGVTLFEISVQQEDTIRRTQIIEFDPPVAGNLSQEFLFTPQNVDPASLPDTMVFEVTGFLIDSNGNCAASVSPSEATSEVCVEFIGDDGELGRQIENIPGLQVIRAIVSGRTVLLPSGGRIMDAVVDTVRRNLLLSNFTRDQIEVFRLESEQFLTAIPVGSEPWGLALKPIRGSSAVEDKDTVYVANSGGTNISKVHLGSVVDGAGAREVPGNRFLTPDVVLFDVETVFDDVGNTKHSVTVIPDGENPGFSDRPAFLAIDSMGVVIYATKTVTTALVGTVRQAWVPRELPAGLPEVRMFLNLDAKIISPEFTAIGNVDDIEILPGGQDGDDQIRITDHVLGEPQNQIIVGYDSLGTVTNTMATTTVSDIHFERGRWDVPGIGFQDTTFIARSGDGGWVLIGEGAVEPVGRVLMYQASDSTTSAEVTIKDILTNPAEVVKGIGLNYDGTMGVARGFQAYFFSNTLRLEGVADLPDGGSGAALHPLHANIKTLTNFAAGEYRPDTHLSFLATGERTIDIVDTFHFNRIGRLFIRDVVTGPLSAVLPFADEQPTVDGDGNPVFCNDQLPVTTGPNGTGIEIGRAVQIYDNAEFSTPLPEDSPITNDLCIVVKLFGITDSGGVVVVDVRKSDVLRDHPDHQN